AEAGAALRPLGDGEPGLPALEGRHLDLGTQRRLGHADRHLAEQAVALALEERMLVHAHDHEKVAGRPASGSALPFAGDAELAAAVHARGDADLQLPRGLHVAAAAAGAAGRGHHPARASAAAAGAGHAEEALLEGHLSAAPARRASGGAGAGGGAAARAGRARLRAGDLDVRLGPEGRLLEGQLQVVAEVGPAARTAAPPAEKVAQPEEVAEDVPGVREDRGNEPARAPQPRVPVE